MAYDLDMLNRLRVNAGKSELKTWKAKQSLLKEKIQELQAAGFVDTIAGANVDAKPVFPPDPELSKAFEKKDEEKPVTKIKTALARGADAGAFTEHSRKSVQDQREKEKKDHKAERKEKKKEEKLPKGQVDPKKDPEKAARQQKHIADKKAKREAEGKTSVKKEKSTGDVAVADLARDLGMEPKVARAKLRRHEKKLEKFRIKGYEEGWTFPKAAKDTIKNILKGS